MKVPAVVNMKGLGCPGTASCACENRDPVAESMAIANTMTQYSQGYPASYFNYPATDNTGNATHLTPGQPTLSLPATPVYTTTGACAAMQWLDDHPFLGLGLVAVAAWMFKSHRARRRA